MIIWKSFLKGMLKWWGFWWQHLEQTLLSRTNLEKQQNSWQGVLKTDKLSRQILEEYVQGWQSQICVSCDPWHHGAASNWGVGIEGVHEEHADGWGGSQDQRAGVSGDLKFFLLISGFRCVLMRWCPQVNLPVHQRPLCVWSMQAWHSGRTSFATYSYDFCLCVVYIVYSPGLCLHLRQWLSQPYHMSNAVKYRIVPPAETRWLGEHMALRRCWGQAFSRLKWLYHLNIHCHYHSY